MKKTDIKDIVTLLEKQLLAEDDISINIAYGATRCHDLCSGGVHQKLNGTSTITFDINGGARDVPADPAAFGELVEPSGISG